MQPTVIPSPALRISVHGIVQGVGFRPFVYRLAHRYALVGTVVNNGEGVCIHVGGPAAALEAFVTALQSEAPPVARINRIEVRPAEPVPEDTTFRILPSQQGARPSTQIAPDIALCADCLREILDPDNRRFGYPFTNCTNCGPRFSIVERIPYDRPIPQCASFPCVRSATANITIRLTAVSMPNPTPARSVARQLSWHDSEGLPLAGDCLALAADALAEGRVVAIKGLGGFHLATDACSEQAVTTLRVRKNRPSKPLAIMVRDLETAARFCRLSDEEAAVAQFSRTPDCARRAASGFRTCCGNCPRPGAYRSDAALHALASSAAQSAANAPGPGDDQRQPQRRADLYRQRGGLAAAPWPGRFFSPSQPGHRHPS